MEILYIAMVIGCFLIGLFVGNRGGYRYGYSSGRVDGAKEMIQKFEARHEAIKKSYIEARDKCNEARDEFIAMYDSLKAYKEELESIHGEHEKNE